MIRYDAIDAQAAGLANHPAHPKELVPLSLLLAASLAFPFMDASDGFRCLKASSTNV